MVDCKQLCKEQIIQTMQFKVAAQWKLAKRALAPCTGDQKESEPRHAVE